MTTRANICSQYIHCLMCPLSVAITGKDCRELTYHEIQRYGGYEMNIEGKWLEEPEINAYIAELKDEIKILREALARRQENDGEDD